MSQDRILKEKVILNSMKVNFPAKPVISADCKDFIIKCLGYK
jgi:tousled-like kinase